MAFKVGYSRPEIEENESMNQLEILFQQEAKTAKKKKPLKASGSTSSADKLFERARRPSRMVSTLRLDHI
jgi:hypothetical protein